MSKFSTNKKIAFSTIAILVLLLTLEAISVVAEKVIIYRKKIDLPPKKMGEYRIFVYGGSTVAGHPVPELGFVEQMQFWFAKSYPEKSIKVFNFGKRGKSSSYVITKILHTLHNKPDLVIVLSGHNEYLNRQKITPYFNFRMSTNSLTLVKIAKYGLDKILLKREKSSPDQIKTYPPLLFKQKKEIYSNNIKIIVTLLLSKKIPLMLGTVSANILDWPPVYHHKGADYIQKIASYRKLLANKQLAKAKKEIDKNKSDAMFSFLLGKIYLAQKKYSKARQFFIRAKDLDPCPWRALSSFNQVIRQQKNVYIVDIDALFCNRSKHKLVGFNLMADNCHPTPKANALIAKEIIKSIVQNGLLGKKTLPHNLCSFSVFSTEKKSFNKMYFDYLLQNALYCLKAPFYNFDMSKKYLQQALKIQPKNAIIWANLATISLLKENKKLGKKQLKNALKFNNGPLDIKDRLRFPYLQKSLQKMHIDINQLKQ